MPVAHVRRSTCCSLYFFCVAFCLCLFPRPCHAKLQRRQRAVTAAFLPHFAGYELLYFPVQPPLFLPNTLSLQAGRLCVFPLSRCTDADADGPQRHDDPHHICYIRIYITICKGVLNRRTLVRYRNPNKYNSGLRQTCCSCAQAMSDSNKVCSRGRRSTTKTFYCDGDFWLI